MLLVVALLLAEVVLRLGLAFVVGPSVLRYGFGFDRFESTQIDREKFSVEEHANRQSSYSRYLPNQKRTDYDRETGEMFRVAINSQGFRGKDFEVDRPAGIVRVISLGASSTFGYTNRDGETYPAQLETWLNSHCPGTRFEVLNLGIPHLESPQVATLLEEEGLAFSPNVITLYAGSNDAAGIQARIHAYRNKPDIAAKPPGPEATLPWSLWQKLSNRLLAAALLDQLLLQTREDVVPDVVTHAAPARERYRNSLDRILEAAHKSGATLIVATQQARSMMIPREEIRGVTYAEEVARVRAKLALRGRLRVREVKLLTHDLLMADLIAWATGHDVTLVDTRAALDPDRDTLVSHVHLSPRGNHVIAEQLGAAILHSHCPAKVSPSDPS